MFFFLPVGTDAPIYHFPYTTIGLIVANCACFAATGCGNPLLTEPWLLHFGIINPLEWFTNMFAHAGFAHLIGNMIFLWTFGLVVEGKLGWKRMLGTYLAIGLVQSALIQTLMLIFPGGGALGASSAIYGLMAICCVWAPKNDLTYFYTYFIWFIPRSGTIGVAYMYVALFYIGWDFLMFSLTGGTMGTSALHLSGAIVGFGVGVLYLKKEWVDCEKWDLFRVLSGNYGRFADSSTTVGSHANPQLMFGKKDVSVKDDIPDNSLSAQHIRKMEEIVTAIKAGDVMTASEELLNLRMEDSDARVSGEMLKKLAIGLLKADMPEDAEIYLEEYIERYPEESSWARVKLAQLFVTVQQRPAAALALLKKVRLSQLGEEQTAVARKVGAAAKKMVKSGVKDQGPSW